GRGDPHPHLPRPAGHRRLRGAVAAGAALGACYFLLRRRLRCRGTGRARTAPGLGRVQLGLAQLAVAVGIHGLEPGLAALLGPGLAVGLVDEAVLVGVHALEPRGRRGQGLGLADAAVLVGIHVRAGETEAKAAVAAAAPVAAVLHARQLVALQLAVLVAVQLVEAPGQARMRRGLAAIDHAVLVGVQRRARL